MKALTIRQPWIDAIVHSQKRCENRSWPPPASIVGQRILLHAAKADDRHAVLCRDAAWTDRRGVILAAATITSHHAANTRGPLCCAPWGFPDAYHWQLRDVTALPEPVHAKGALGFWTPPPAVLAAVEQQLAATPA